MKIRLPPRSAALAAVLLLAAPAPAQESAEAAPESAEPTPAPELTLAARVNDTEISLRDLAEAVNHYVRANRLGPDSGFTIPQIQKTVLERLIATALVNQRGRELDVHATIEEIDERMAGLRAQAGSPEDFRLMLTVQNLTEPLLRQKIGEQITAEKVIDAEVLSTMEFTPRDVREYYEEHRDELTGEERVHVRHIVVRLGLEMTEEERLEARERIDAIKARLDAGEAFEDLAVELSEDAAAAEGGDLGWIPRNTVTGPFQMVAFSLPVGKISEVVATDYGYHILEVLEREESRTLALEEARPLIENRLRDERVPIAVREYIAGLKKDAEIEVFVSLDESDS